MVREESQISNKQNNYSFLVKVQSELNFVTLMHLCFFLLSFFCLARSPSPLLLDGSYSPVNLP